MDKPLSGGVSVLKPTGSGADSDEQAWGKQKGSLAESELSNR